MTSLCGSVVIVSLIQWLKTGFLEYLSEWEKWIDSKHGLTTAERTRLCLSQETLIGWKITGKFIF